MKLKDLLKEHHILGVLPSEKLMKMKWNPLKEEAPKPEGESEEDYDEYTKGLGPEGDGEETGEDIYAENIDNRRGVSKDSFLQSVKEYARLGEDIYRSHKLNKIAEAVTQLCEDAENITLTETEEWFDSVIVKRDMKSIREAAKLFGKTTNEVNKMQQRLESLYEEIGVKLGKYYDISEAMDAVGKEDDDVDNDGDSDDSDDYLKKKRAAISKAVANERKDTMKLSKMMNRKRK